MKWVKQGLIYDPRIPGRHPKLQSHAANPLPIHLTGDIYRIFYSGRDIENRSSVGAFDFDLAKQQVVQDYHAPFLIHGEPGTFYQDGISIGNCYKVDGEIYMLFMGWQYSGLPHWRGDIGRIHVSENFTLTVTPKTPFIGSDEVDPISLSYPWVFTSSYSKLEMIYGSTQSWQSDSGEMIHVLNSAESTDGGKSWSKKGVAVPFQLGIAQAFSRPTLTTDSTGNDHLWFSYRGGNGDKYKIGYASRQKGAEWELGLSKAGIAPSKHGWDSEMIEYPFVLEHKNELFMFYNGNGNGFTGIGLAMMEKADLYIG